MNNRYDAEGSQSTYEPGSDEQVLANKLGITDPEEMDEAELVLLEKLYQSVLIEDLPDRQLTAQDLKDWHRKWLSVGRRCSLGKYGQGRFLLRGGAANSPAVR
jgi:cell filamentation protein